MHLDESFPSFDAPPNLNALLKQLTASEKAGQPLVGARLAAQISEYVKRQGHYRACAHWLGWSLQLHDSQRPLADSYWQTLLDWVTVKLLVGHAHEIDTLLTHHANTDVSERPTWWLGIAQLLVDVHQGRLEHAAQRGSTMWNRASRREDLPDLANAWVRALLGLGRASDAAEVADRLACLTDGLGRPERAKARLLIGLVQSQRDPGLGTTTLRDALTHLPFPEWLQATLVIATNHERLDMASQAHAEFETMGRFLHEIDRDGLVFLLGQHRVMGSAELSGRVQPGLELRLLGVPEVRYHHRTLSLRPRFVELLAVLAATPEGMSNAELSLAVYGESYDPSCCKTEINRLKRQVPLKSQPYRLNVPVWADFLEIHSLIETDRIDEAIDLYRGPLLTASEAPELCRRREILHAALCAAAHMAPSPESLWRLANKMRDDLELWEGVLTRLPNGDPRIPLARAHAHSLRRSWGI